LQPAHDGRRETRLNYKCQDRAVNPDKGQRKPTLVILPNPWQKKMYMYFYEKIFQEGV
jgi:hypothetical protein